MRVSRSPSLVQKITFLSIIQIAFVVSLRAQNFVQTGIASYYADKFEGRLTASGEKYKHSRLTAAHRTLPFGTIVRVTHTGNGNSVDVTINDRGPFVSGRIIDLSKAAAEELGMVNQGLAEVEIKVVDAGDGKGNNYSTGNNTDVADPPDESELYSLDISRVSPTGYGVQIGSFQELANLVRLAANLKASYRKDVVVEVGNILGVKHYKIIIGKEKTRDKADKLKDRLVRKYPDCFVVQFSTL